MAVEDRIQRGIPGRFFMVKIVGISSSKVRERMMVVVRSEVKRQGPTS